MLISAIATSLLLSSALQKQTVRLLSEGYGPSGAISVAKPKVAWKAWPEGGQVTSVRLVINSKPYTARYDAATRELIAEGLSNLTPGTYKVEAGLTVDGWANFDEKWSFTVGNDVKPLPIYTRDEKSAVNELNGIRAKHKLPAMFLDPYLTMTARAHTDYLSLNDTTSHNEREGLAGFTGIMASDRGRKHGHVGGIWEVVAGGTTTPEESVYDLWDAPYHRIALMQSGRNGIGVGWKNGHFTMNGAPSWQKGYFVAPYDGQQNVPIAWANQESPNPVRSFPDARFLLGYPIVLSGTEVESAKLEYVSATLEDSKGTPVPFYLRHRGNDEHLTNALIMIPKLPLKFDENYTVNVSVNGGGESATKRTWTFKTEADNKS